MGDGQRQREERAQEPRSADGSDRKRQKVGGGGAVIALALLEDECSGAVEGKEDVEDVESSSSHSSSSGGSRRRSARRKKVIGEEAEENEDVVVVENDHDVETAASRVEFLRVAVDEREAKLSFQDRLDLEDGQFVGSACIDFCNRYLLGMEVERSRAQEVGVLSANMFPILAHETWELSGAELAKTLEERYQRVRRWTTRANLDIFSKQYVVMPINLYKHWMLVIVCFPTQYPGVPEAVRTAPPAEVQGTRGDLAHIFLLNSLEELLVGPRRKRVINVVRAWLTHEWSDKKAEDTGVRVDFGRMTYKSIHVPQQPNATDCGPYIMQYLEDFTRDPVKWFMRGRSAKRNRQKWFFDDDDDGAGESVPERYANKRRDVRAKLDAIWQSVESGVSEGSAMQVMAERVEAYERTQKQREDEEDSDDSDVVIVE